MTTIAFMACETTLPGSGRRRADAHEHDLMVAALEPHLTDSGMTMRVIDWEADLTEFDGVSLALLGTPWNYQDKHEAYLAKLDQLEKSGITLCNPTDVVRWNSRKTYLRELAQNGAPTIPTVWLDRVGAQDIATAMDQFACGRLVVKRQVGAGAEGQVMFSRDSLPDAEWSLDYAAMLQPFIATIQREGELSLIFVGGEFSHALRKEAADGDYRIQSIYGGTESAYHPTAQEVEDARRILTKLPFEMPLYARIDMVRGDNDRLLVMEVELIEPYLYPEQGNELGSRLVAAITSRLP